MKKPGLKKFLFAVLVAAWLVHLWDYWPMSPLHTPPPVEETRRLLGKTEAAIQAVLDKKFKPGDTRAAVEDFLVEQGHAPVLLMPNFSGGDSKFAYIFGWDQGYEIYIEADYEGEALRKKLSVYTARVEPH